MSKLREKFTEIYNLIGDEEIDNPEFEQELNMFLDMLYEEDYFGTEGQNDPRYDWRDK